MTIATVENFAEAKSRHITPAKSMHDFRVGDGFLIKSGGSVTHKLVKELKPPNTVVVSDPDGGGVQSISLNPDSPAKDGAEFKYWIDEGEHNMSNALKEMGIDDEFDDDFPAGDDLGLDGDLGVGDDLGLDGELGIDGDLGLDGDLGIDDDFAEDLSSFLGEEGSDPGSQVPDTTTAGGVTAPLDGNDGEDPADTPPPADTIGIQNPSDVQTMAGAASSNVGGGAPADQVQTNGDVGGSPTIDGTLPQSGEHTPGTSDKSQGGSGVSEAITNDVNDALHLVHRGADPSMLASRLLRGAGA